MTQLMRLRPLGFSYGPPSTFDNLVTKGTLRMAHGRGQTGGALGRLSESLESPYSWVLLTWGPLSGFRHMTWMCFLSCRLHNRSQIEPRATVEFVRFVSSAQSATTVCCCFLRYRCVSVSIGLSLYIYTHMYIHVYMSIYVLTCRFFCFVLCMCVCVCVCVCACACCVPGYIVYMAEGFRHVQRRI